MSLHMHASHLHFGLATHERHTHSNCPSIARLSMNGNCYKDKLQSRPKLLRTSGNLEFAFQSGLEAREHRLLGVLCSTRNWNDGGRRAGVDGSSGTVNLESFYNTNTHYQCKYQYMANALKALTHASSRTPAFSKDFPYTI